MRAFTLDSFETQPALRDDRPEPRAADDELLVRVQASSVNGADVAIASGMLKEMVAHEFPVTLGRDFAGIVEQAGSEVSGLSEGAEVFGFNPGMSPAVHEGTWAELIAVPESMATRKPEGV